MCVSELEVNLSCSSMVDLCILSCISDQFIHFLVRYHVVVVKCCCERCGECRGYFFRFIVFYVTYGMAVMVVIVCGVVCIKLPVRVISRISVVMYVLQLFVEGKV